MPLISVIVPAYEAQDFIAEAVRSVLHQTFSDIEIVIAADDGRDYSAVLSAQGLADKRLRCVSTGGVAAGVAKARNAALTAARGRLVASLDADDLLLEDALQRMAPLALEHGAAYSAMEFVEFDDGRKIANYNRTMPEGTISLEDALTSNIHSFAWIVFDRERLPDARWPEWLACWEDMFFMADCCDRLGGIYHVPQPLYRYRRRDGSLCNRPDAPAAFITGAERIVQALERNNVLNAENRAILKRYAQCRARLEAEFERSGLQDFQVFLRDHLAEFYQL